MQELLVIVVVMQAVESRGETKVSQLDVTATVQQDIVGLDITVSPQSKSMSKD